MAGEGEREREISAFPLLSNDTCFSNCLLSVRISTTCIFSSTGIAAPVFAAKAVKSSDETETDTTEETEDIAG